MTAFRFSTIRAKGRVSQTVLINLSLIGCLAVSVLCIMLGAAIHRSFSALEERELAGHLNRVTHFQVKSLSALGARSKDWGVWDDTFEYSTKMNSDYITKNVNAESFAGAMVDGLLVFRFKDGMAASFAFDQASGQEKPELAGVLKTLASRPQFVGQVRERGEFQSFVVLREQLYALAVVQIRRSDGSGTPPGFLVFIQRIDREDAAQALQVPVTLSAPSFIKTVQVKKFKNSVLAEAPFRDNNGRVVAAINLQLKRPLFVAAKELLFFMLCGVSTLFAVILALLNRRLGTLVVEPIERLHAHLVHIRETGEFSVLEGIERVYEFAALQTEFNCMTAEIQQMRVQLESQSFSLGKSQSAVGLMHNLRNCLSPVRVILESLEKDVTAAVPALLPRAVQELAQPTLNQDRRAKLAIFLEAAHSRIGAHGANQRQQLREAARNLMNAFAAIDIAAQAKEDISLNERCDLGSLLSYSGNIARFADDLPINVEVRCEGSIAAVGNRVLLSQVLENLVTNAVEAIRDSGRGDGFVLLRATTESCGKQCRITVVDNGDGFDLQTKAQIFERGYSTRTSKSGGLGLHWCANTICAMAGSLSVVSAGRGLGARAVITLPAWNENVLLATYAA